MKTDKASSGSSSAGGTSKAKPPPPTAPAQTLSEAEYLQQQAHNAQLALAGAWDRAKADFGHAISPKLWAREHPWIALGAGAIGGFVAAATLVPSKEQQALRKLAAIERALNPPRHREPEHENGDEHKHGPGMLSTILHEALGVLRPALLSLMATRLAGSPDGQPTTQAAQQEDDQQQFYGGA